MAYPEALTEGLRALSRFLVGEAKLDDTLHRVAVLSTEAIPGASYAGMTLAHDDGPRTSVYSDPASPEIDQAQYDTGEGPCLDAMRTGEINRIDSTTDDTRWIAFSRACLDHGIHSTLSLPLVVADGGSPVGALNLYSHQAAAFDDTTVEHGVAFAEQAAVVLINAEHYWGAHELSEQLQTALRSRPVIEQAKGVLVAREGCTTEEAFDMLRRASQRTNIKLRDMAALIVERAEHGSGADVS